MLLPAHERAHRRLAWIFLAPSLCVFAAVALYPLLQTFLLSLTDTRAFDAAGAKWVGLGNYRTLFSDRDFVQAAVNTGVFAAASVALETLLGLGVALLLNQKFRGRGAARAMLLIPWAIPTVVSTRLWAWMLNDVFGVANDLLADKLHILSEPMAWTARPGWAMASLVFVDVWKTTPFVALLLLAGLQSIGEEVYEAASVDGAGPVRRLVHITLPLLKPALVVTLLFRTMDALRVFDLVWILTSGQSRTETLGTYNYRALMEHGKLGYGSAASVSIFLLLGVFVFAVLALFPIDREEGR